MCASVSVIDCVRVRACVHTKVVSTENLHIHGKVEQYTWIQICLSGIVENRVELQLLVMNILAYVCQHEVIN